MSLHESYSIMIHPSIHFKLSFPEPQTHYVEVYMEIKNLKNKEFVDIKMPVWAPGSYLIREYSKNVERFRAESFDNKPLTFRKTNKNTWRIYPFDEEVIIHYAVYAFETSVRTSFIDGNQAFISPVGTFMYLDGRLDLAASVEIDLPKNWSHISTGLQKTTDNTFYAENFDILFDSPFQIGNQDTWKFDIDGILHECAMVGLADYDKDQLTADITRIVREENKIWQSNPNNYYLFVTHHYQQAHGGLEHLNSTILATSRFSYSNTASYKNYLSLVAHEYFHLWNVKRLRPKELGPFDYNQENYTTGLWIMEGITSYYDNLIIRRCNIYTEEEYLKQLSNDFNIVFNRPGHLLQSAAQASYDTWIKHYRPDENSQNVSISYYNKGAIHALVLDIEILATTKGKYRLDDVLRKAYKHFYLIENRGFEEEELLQLAEQYTSVALKEIFDAAHSTEEFDYNYYLNKVGYELIDLNEGKESASLGIKTVYYEGKCIIKSMDRESAAWLSGLSVNDEIIAINNYRVDGQSSPIEYFIQKASPDEHLTLLISRDGIINTIETKFKKDNKKAYIIQRKKEANAQEKALGKQWLSL